MCICRDGATFVSNCLSCKRMRWHVRREFTDITIIYKQKQPIANNHLLPTKHKACAWQHHLTTTAIPSHKAVCLLVCCKLVTIHGRCMLVIVKQIIRSARLSKRHSVNGDIHQATLWQHSPLTVSERIHSCAAVTQVCSSASHCLLLLPRSATSASHCFHCNYCTCTIPLAC